MIYIKLAFLMHDTGSRICYLPQENGLFMHQSILAVNIPRGFVHHFLPGPRVFPQKILPMGFRLGPEIDKNLQCISILVNIFKRLLKTAGKTFVFFYNCCICFLLHLFLK